MNVLYRTKKILLYFCKEMNIKPLLIAITKSRYEYEGLSF